MLTNIKLKTSQKILFEKILKATVYIQRDFPWLYNLLDETPLLLKNFKKVNISKKDLKIYLEELVSQIDYYKKTNNKEKTLKKSVKFNK